MSKSTAHKEGKPSLEHSDTELEAYNDWPNDAGFNSCPEQLTPIDLTIVGEIPTYVRGVLYRTGPGGKDLITDSGKPFTMNHWFDGFTRTHRFQIHSSDKVTYRSRTACDGVIETIKKTGNLDGFSFAQRRDPCQSFFKKFMGVFIPPKPSGPKNADSVNVGVTLSINMPGLPSTQNSSSTGHGGIKSLTGKTDANSLQMLDPETLEPIGVASQTVLHPDLRGQFSAAHARTDPMTGDFYNFNLEIGAGKPTYKIFCASRSTGQTSIIATIQNAMPSYIHSFFLSKSYLILAVWPSKYAYGGIMIPYERNVLDAIAPWDVNAKSKFYVIDRLTGKGVVAVYETSAFFAFHTTNAWEEEDDIVLEVCAYKNIDVLHKFYVERLLSTTASARDWVNKAHPSFTRFRLREILTGTTEPSGAWCGSSGGDSRKADIVFDKSIAFELPCVNPSYITKPTRYVYGVSDRGKTTLLDGIVKHDTVTDTTIYWETHGHSPGEPIFVENPDKTAEDDGVLLSVVLNGKMEKSYLLILSAKDLKEVARVEMESAVGFGFHGTYFGDGLEKNVDI